MISVIEYLEQSNEKYKNDIAVIEEDKKITYEDLTNYSKKVGSYIANLKIFNEPIVIFMDKGIDALISFFGCAYAGCCYSLVNPSFPLNRINQIKEIIDTKLVITNEENYDIASSCFGESNVKLINDLKKEKIDNNILEEVKMKHIDTDPLYINFTSGSTGIPKGVVISHRSVIDFIDNFTSLFNFTHDDIIANQAPFDFDVSVKDIYSSLKVGAKLLIVPTRYFSNPSLLLDYLCDNKATTMVWAVSALCLITTFHGLDYKVPECVNKILFSGEVMPIKHLKMWMNSLPNCMFVNLYGPTEITCNCTYHIIDKSREYSEKIPIGKPFKNERVFLLDKDDKIINSKNVQGEICVCGTALGLGYYKNIEQTNNHFVQNPNMLNYNELIYRTGDLAYYNDNNELIFDGRKDFQIKYLGHRIELEEIDKSIMECDKVIRCATLFDEEKSKLIEFYIGDIDKKELHEFLKEIVPVHMIPGKFIKMDEFPMTKNGKIDRKELMKIYKEK